MVGSSCHYPDGLGERTAPQQSYTEGMPDEAEQGHRPASPSLEGVLEEIDPFLDVINAREWSECGRYLVLTNIGSTMQGRVRVDTLFRSAK
ncbi:hypothetical protein BOTBODRAFT_27965 [Botryobasidium botryosum FD-172 SS1]|uniref:Uncharacterized protein n=1 Tax=Botryobasidium botryosum (strain FD-172 SS1) TaxID=930990 RepID=A0A067MXH3_BOTB1|nr:hypothetical protein BOTBODRAFT_27965 [Botryobasidium botryosum FD-172 SS1]